MLKNINKDELFFAYKILENSLNILKDNYSELIEIVKKTKKDNSANLISYSRKINQCIHNFAASIGTCIERERQFENKYFDNNTIEECKQKIKELFSSPECEFVDNLRNFILHYMLPQISWGFNCDGTIKDIMFQTDIFLKFKSWKGQSKKFIESSSGTVDVIKAIKCYYTAFCLYYDKWLFPKLFQK